MGLLKTGLKLVGTAALVVTGTASTVLKGVSEAAGVEIGSELFGATKDASFDGIRNLWNSDDCDEVVNHGEDISVNVEDAARRKMADTAYRAAQIAKKNGDEEKYEKYMEKYYEYK